MAARRIDPSLAAVTLALTAHGIVVLYSAGQTDVPTSVAHVWERQVVWLEIGRASCRERVLACV